MEILSQKIDKSIFEVLYSEKVAPSPLPCRRANYWGDSPQLIPTITESAFHKNWNLLYSVDHVRPTVIEGDPGSGKTTWIRYFFQSDMCGLFHHNNIAAIVDCSMTPTISTQRFLSPRIESLYEETFLAVGKAVDKWTPGYQKHCWSVEKFAEYNAHQIQSVIAKALKFLHSQKEKKRVWLVVDNLDYSPRKDQADMVRIARSIMRDLKVEAVVSVRPQTIRRGRALRDEFEREGVRAVQVPHYDISSIVSRRAELYYDGLDELCKRIGTVTLNDEKGKEHVFKDRKDFEELYDSICGILLSNTFAQGFLEANHNCDIGKLLNDLSKCLGGSVFSSEIVTQAKEKKRDERRFFTSYLRRDYRHYWPEHFESVVNLFQTDPANPHTERPLLAIRVLEQLSNEQNSLKWGQLLTKLSDFSYNEPDIALTVKSLLSSGMIIDTDHMTDWEAQTRNLKKNEKLTLSEKGMYYHETLLYEIRYMSAIAESHFFDDTIVVEDLSKGIEIGDAAQNVLTLLNEIYRYVYDDLIAMEKKDGVKMVRKFMHSVGHLDGLFIGCATNLLKSLSEIVKGNRSQISDTVWNWWASIDKRVKLMELWRKRLLGGEDISIAESLPPPSRIGVPLPDQFLRMAEATYAHA